MSHGIARRVFGSLLVAAPVALSLAGCESDDALTPDGARSASETVVVMSQLGGAAASVAPASLDVQSAEAGPLDRAAIRSINLTLTGVQVQKAGATEDDGWISLGLGSATTLNLLALPTTAAQAIALARGTLPAGAYANVRLLYRTATIVLNRDVTAGGGAAATTYRAGQEYPLRIGGGNRNELKVPTAAFTVTATSGATIPLVFDAALSIRNVIASPHDLHMPPVISAPGVETRGG